MSEDLTDKCLQMATTDFVNNLKSLSLYQTANQYLTTQLKYATLNGLTENKSLGLAIVDNFYRIVSIFDKKLLDNNENSYQTNLFLEVLSNAFHGLCLLELFVSIKDLYCTEIIFHNYLTFT
ncbi:unnamed protein product [Rotaria sp. Silwood1]|nr:unnamed protein product [Rotaria sp. Silwood1]CAF5011772.1 unnamed protein product [Rotaria sp. Silwood1]